MKPPNWRHLILLPAVIGLQVLYWPTRDAGFVTDFTGLAERITTHGAPGILSSFDFPALQPVTSLFYYLFYHQFGVFSPGWYWCATLLHTANAVLLFYLLARLLQHGESFSRYSIAGFGALLFLFHPYAGEVVVWRVGLHYLLVTFWILALLWYTLRWLERPGQSSRLAVIGLQLAALLTYELAIIAPLLSLAFILWKWPEGRGPKALRTLIAPQLGLVGLYFLANRLLLGAWVGHYGSEVHLRFPVAEMIANTGRYFFKWIGFSRYWPHSGKAALAQGLEHPLSVTGLILLGLGLLLLLLRNFRKAAPPQQLAWVFAGMTLVALGPVLNLYFNFLLHIENDRYSYLASLFFYPAWMALLSRLPRPLFLGLAVIYFTVSLWLLHRTNQYWAQSTTVYRGLLEDFDAYGQDTCYLLNLPDNLQGAPLFRDYSGNDRAFADALQFVAERPYDGVLEEVVQYNMTGPEDGASVEADSSGLRVTFEQWGNWWWRRGIGASNYRDSTYIFHNEGHHYRLKWRTAPSSKAGILYQTGKRWRSWGTPEN